MSFEFKPIRYRNTTGTLIADGRDKEDFYRELAGEIEGLLDRAWFTNLANASAAISAHLPDLNWTGFYLTVEREGGRELVLGPFQGLPACLRIPFGRGVCGAAAERKEPMLVHDVHEFPGHIACDVRSQSEIVIPLVLEDRIVGVLDLDSPNKNRFDEQDRRGLEAIAAILVHGTSWPTSFV